jgi:hypothetical protein
MAVRLQDAEADMTECADTKARFFYLREPKRGVFVVCIQAWDEVYETVEITREQLANFLVDGTAMALRDSKGKIT